MRRGSYNLNDSQYLSAVNDVTSNVLALVPVRYRTSARSISVNTEVSGGKGHATYFPGAASGVQPLLLCSGIGVLACDELKARYFPSSITSMAEIVA